MSDEDSTAATPDEPTAPVAAPAVSSTPEPAAAHAADERPGFYVPTWLAGVAAVVIVLLIGVAGFAIGHSTADDGRGDRPALIGDRGGMPGGRHGDQQGGQLPGGPGGPGGRPGGQFPGGPGGPQGGPGSGDQGGPGSGDEGGNTQGRSDGSSGPQGSSGTASSSGQGDPGTRGS